MVRGRLGAREGGELLGVDLEHDGSLTGAVDLELEVGLGVHTLGGGRVEPVATGEGRADDVGGGGHGHGRDRVLLHHQLLVRLLDEGVDGADVHVGNVLENFRGGHRLRLLDDNVGVALDGFHGGRGRGGIHLGRVQDGIRAVRA